MAETATFTLDSAKRIAKVVRKVERDARRPAPQRRRHHSPAGSSLLKHGKLDDALVFGATATCSIWTGTINAETDSGTNVTVACFKLNAGESIAAGSKVDLGWINGGWQVLNVNCPV